MWTVLLHRVICTLILTICAAALSPSLPARANDLAALIERPSDTAEARRVRIWLPVERSSICLVKIEIANDSGRVIRKVIERPLGKGYYNFYWDKRDDSGMTVPPGKYAYRIDDCGKKKSGWLEAAYHPMELRSSVEAVDSIDPSLARLSLGDSARVSVILLNRRGVPMDTLVSDSLFLAGESFLRWTPPSTGYRGRFEYLIDVAGYILRHTFEL